MAGIPAPGSSSNETKGYYRVEDVLAAFKDTLDPQLLKQILETIPIHNVRPKCARRGGTNLLTPAQITKEPLSASQHGISSDQPTFRDRSVSSPVRSRSRSPCRSHSTPESSKALTARKTSRPSLVPLKERKNCFAVCVTCWAENRVCDHKVPCSSCTSAGNPSRCYYARCPSVNCGLRVKCPTYHMSGQSTVGGHVVSSLHLIALLARPSAQLHDYSFQHIIVVHNTPHTAQWLFGKIRKSLESPPQGVEVNAEYISNQIKTLGKSAFSDMEKHKTHVKMINDFVQEFL
jgi:hypothetical protein